jgi:hypothetical protein
LIGDLVLFIDARDHRLIISGRIKQFLSLCGEHLSLDNINQALSRINTPNRLIEPEFTIFVNKEHQLHHWFVEPVDSNMSPEALMQAIDRELSSLNDDYYSARKYNLKDPRITCLPKGSIYRYMKSLEKIGAQNKMPSVLNDDQAKVWFEFLTREGLG